MLNPSRRGEATSTHQHGTVDGTWHLAKFKTKTTHNDLVIQESRGLLSFSVYCLCCAARSYSFSLKIFSAFEWNWNNMKFMTNKLCKMISLKTPNYLACQSFRSFHSANTHNSFHFKFYEGKHIRNKLKRSSYPSSFITTNTRPSDQLSSHTIRLWPYPFQSVSAHEFELASHSRNEFALECGWNSCVRELKLISKDHWTQILKSET